jgi:hypothetical protein
MTGYSEKTGIRLLAEVKSFLYNYVHAVSAVPLGPFYYTLIPKLENNHPVVA